MSLIIRLIFLSLLFCFLCNIAKAENDEGGCHLLKINNEKQESKQHHILKLLRSKYSLFGKSYEYTDPIDDETYHFSICADVDKSLPEVAVMKKSTLEGDKNNLGMRNHTSLMSSEGVWIQMNFYNGTDSSNKDCKYTSSSVMILCDRSKSTGEFKLLYQDAAYCQYVFELRISALCGPGPGLGGWSIFFILLIVGFLVYFVAGFVYLRFVIGNQGIEQIPHRLFWIRVGNMLANGCSAVCRCGQYCEEASDDADVQSPYSSNYSPIGGSTPALHSDAPLLQP